MKVEAFLPHRDPFLFIDEVIEVSNEKIVAKRFVSPEEDFFKGHFPDFPIMPGVLILEAMAQAAGVLGFKTMGNNDKLYLYAGIDNARFKRPVVPGDRLEFDVALVKERRGIWKFKGTASVDGDIACVAEFMCAMREIA